MKRLLLSIFSLVLLLSLTACFGGEVDDSHEKKNYRAHVTLDTKNVPPLSGGYYETWVFVDGTAQSAGKFNVDDKGVLVDFEGNAIPDKKFQISYEAKNAATSFMVTAQPKDGSVTTRTNTAILEGSFEVGKVSPISFAGFDPEEVLGQYMLATYSDDNDNKNEASGVWFFQNRPDKRKYLLELPQLTTGWQYEGWVNVNGKLVSLGKFTNVRTADLMTRFNDSKDDVPLSPGEDFLVADKEQVDLNMPLRLNAGGVKLFITIEPVYNNVDMNGEAPFTFKILEATIPRGARTRVPLDMVNTAIEFIPTGKVIYIPELALPKKK